MIAILPEMMRMLRSQAMLLSLPQVVMVLLGLSNAPRKMLGRLLIFVTNCDQTENGIAAKLRTE